jgi:hypothetical protein
VNFNGPFCLVIFLQLRQHGADVRDVVIGHEKESRRRVGGNLARRNAATT